MGVKRATSLFTSFCSNGAQQVAAFCCPLYCTLKRNDFSGLTDFNGSTNVRVGSTIFSARQPKQQSSANAAGGIPQQSPRETMVSGGTSQLKTSQGTNPAPGAEQDTFPPESFNVHQQ